MSRAKIFFVTFSWYVGINTCYLIYRELNEKSLFLNKITLRNEPNSMETGEDLNPPASKDLIRKKHIAMDHMAPEFISLAARFSIR